MVLLLLCVHLSTILLPHLVILHHLLKGLHPVLFKHHQGLILGLVGCRGLTPGLVGCRRLGLLFTLHCKQPHVFSCAPLASDVDHSDIGSWFWLCFVQGNSSCCNGCKGQIARGQALNYLLQTTWWYIIERIYSSLIPTWEACNVYYHPWKTSHFQNLIPSEHIKVDHVVLSKFNCWLLPCSQSLG